MLLLWSTVYGDRLADSCDSYDGYLGADGGGSVGRVRRGSWASEATSQLLRPLPPRRRQRLRTPGLTRHIQRFNSRTVALLVRMVITLGHRHRLMAGEVVDLLDGDAEVEHSRAEGMAEVRRR